MTETVAELRLTSPKLLRSSLLVGVLLVTSVAVDGARQASKPASPSNALDQALSQAHSLNLKQITDPFAPADINAGLVGRTFKVHIPMEADLHNDFKTSAFWYYENGRLSFNLFSTDKHHYVVRSRSVPFGSYIGQNAFGATARITKIHVLNDGIIASGDYPSFEWNEELSAPAARLLSHDVEVVIEGAIVRLANGHISDCRAETHSATLSSPSDTLEDACDVGAKLSRVGFVRRSTGAVIKECLLEG